MNVVILSGNIGSKWTGTGVTILSIATGHYVDRSGSEKTEWVSVKTFGKLAEACRKHLIKGQAVEVEAKVVNGSYQKDNTTVYTTEVIAQRIHFGKRPVQAAQNNNNALDVSPNESYQD